MKRDFLEGLGLEKEAVDKIIAEHGRTVQAEQAKVTTKDAELQGANNTIKGLQDSIKKFDGVDIEALQNEATRLKGVHDTELAKAKAEAKNLKRGYSLKGELEKKGVVDPDYLIFKHGGVEKFTFNDEDKPVGIDEVLTPYRESSSNLFAEKEKDPVVDFGASTDSGGSNKVDAGAQFNAILRDAAK